MSQIVPAIRKRNALWPLRRSAKGWQTGTLADRYSSALHHLWRTPVGSFPWQPDYGTFLYKFRGQSFNNTDMAVIQEDLLRATGKWVPDIVILEITFTPGELEGGEDELVRIKCAWAIPEADASGRTDVGRPRFAFGPVTQTITI